MISQATVIGLPQPRSWGDYRQGCLSNFGGGHHSDGHLEAFQHGMETVFNLLENEFPPAELCQAAPRLFAIIKEALDDSQCDGELCAHAWHEKARQIFNQYETNTL